MYKKAQRVIPSEIEFDENAFYSCKCDVNCIDGFFEKGSIVRIAKDVIRRKGSSVTEECIRVYGMSFQLMQHTCDLDYGMSDIPLGVTESNFNSVFCKEDKLTNDIDLIQKNFDRKIRLSGILKTISEASAGIDLVAMGVVFVIVLYKILFITGTGNRELMVLLWGIPLAVIAIACKAASVIISGKATRDRDTDMQTVYEEYREQSKSENSASE